ncbi:MSMEG_0567/Sll0786 family nitrogen starvation N-acetyltransferase [Paraburkholderia tropica]|uniref:N-acetyltransferase (TIGR04045 family) n=1 Tax=Paraburkholderia tropica TaxID=92647 RepID=A0ABX5MFN6_9BURK|nr:MULTISPECIES: MSMEG_0567/Sll0786 family nitrogen starvation N-acetyltransferase [Paraburkholderia]MBB2983856.1 putative N-acetyltransferase (TIGR04045 family) [Paraburkholderia tropica]MDE1140399.1 GNAT family N-acetyltransferase [Paraburkholderia tropica]OBR51858.1 histone acetyltransferase [Paraburkholderia tropica]PXX05943.1 putative N-acetyltransferase (TIGR04045 family) [Paraburkholderia tropica]PZW71800.1 putative N-acetyltransferase (TIGR04045 family) [Paraburkholderia tropica]
MSGVYRGIDSSPEIVVRWARERWEIDGAYALRREVFCREQGLFEHDDLDAVDAHAQLLVAVCDARVVGTVRIHRRDAADCGTTWFGSRLAVSEAFRRHGRIGATLIRLAVSSAHALGCETFLAHVQAQNAPLFQRLHWRTLDVTMLFGLEHHRMQADLAHYPPCATPYLGFVVDQRRAA